MKIHDELIQLRNIPFDASKNAEVTKALRTLGSSIQEVSNIVKLVKRTNKSLFFEFIGNDSVLKPFFEQYYNHLSWEEIRQKYGRPVNRTKILKKDNQIPKEENIKIPKEEIIEKEEFNQFEEDLFTFFQPNGIKREDLKYNNDEQTIYISNFPKSALSELLKNATKGSSAITKFLKKYNFQIKGIDIREEPIKISLKSI